MEDDRVAILEAQLAQAKLIAEEADKKYEEVRYDHSLKSRIAGRFLFLTMRAHTHATTTLIHRFKEH